MKKPSLVKYTILLAFFLISASQYLTAQESESELELAIAITPDNKGLEWLACPDFLPCTFAILRGELGGNDMDIYLKFPSKADIPFHTHTSTERMIMIEGEFETTYVGQDSVTLKKGDYAFGPAGLAHDGYCASEKECIMYVGYDNPLDAVPYEK